MAATKTRRKSMNGIKPLPPVQTPQERVKRYIALRSRFGNRDDAEREMFAEDVRAMKKARPEWDAERCAQELRDRGLQGRWGVGWTILVATQALG